MAEDAKETQYQVTCRRPAWPFEDWRYDVLSRPSEKASDIDGPDGIWYSEEECQTLAAVLQVDGVSEDYPFKKQRMATALKKTLANSKYNTNTSEKSTKSKLKDSSRDIYSIDKLALGKTFFHVLVNMAVPEHSEETFVHREDIVELLRATGKYLRQNSDLFTDSKVVPTGSMAEGSKVYTSDEVDFLIVLPSIKDAVSSAEICDSSDLLPVVHFTLGDNQSEENLLKRLGADLDEALQKSLKTGWSVKSLSLSEDRKTQIIELAISEEGNQSVFVQICVSFAIPVNKHDLAVAEDESHPDKIVKVPLQNYALRYLKERDTQLVAILSDEKLKSCAISLESDMANIVIDDLKGTGVAHTYHLAKKVIAIFFPQVYIDKTWRTVIPSHVLLNIVLYLCAYRKNAKMWASTRLHERLIEVLLILERCAEDEAVNLFLLPGMVPLPIYTSNAYYYDPKRSRFLCSEEGYTSEAFECRILDKGVIASLSGHSDLTMHFVPYFSSMRNNEWTFPDKLEELSDLLQEIFKCPVPRMWRDGRFSSVETDSGLKPPAEKRRVSVRKANQKAAASKGHSAVIHCPTPPSKSSKNSSISSSSTKGSKSSAKPLIAPESKIRSPKSATTSPKAMTPTKKATSSNHLRTKPIPKKSKSARSSARRLNCCDVQ